MSWAVKKVENFVPSARLEKQSMEAVGGEKYDGTRTQKTMSM